MKNIMTVCRFCGQIISTEQEFDCAIAAEEWASRNCSCDDSLKYQEVMDSVDNAREFLTELPDKQLTIVCNAVADVGFEVIDSVTIKLCKQKSISVKKNASGIVSVKIKSNKTEQIDL